jgi:hypothetical protein
MKNLLKLLLLVVFGLTISYTHAQQDTVPVYILGCFDPHPQIPPNFLPDSISVNMIGTDSLQIEHYHWSNMCPLSIGLVQTNSQVVHWSIVDTNTGPWCLGDCYMGFAIRIAFPDDSIELSIRGNIEVFYKDSLLNTSIRKREQMNVQLFPNPTKDLSRITFGAPTTAQLSLYNIRGQEIWSEEICNQNDYIIPMQDLAAGTYLLGIRGDKFQLTKKLIKLSD